MLRLFTHRVFQPLGLRSGAKYLSSTPIARQEEKVTPSFADIITEASASAPNRAAAPLRHTSSTFSSQSSSGITEQIHRYILYCNFTKNNTHLTLSAVTEDLQYINKNPQLSFNDKVLYYYQLPQKVKLSLSTGQLGFRKSARGEYEASFQTSAKMFALMKEKGFLNKDLQIVIKNFGKGREAFFDALKGKEGDFIRNKITRLSDNTKLKFGGTRSPKSRRL